jgi:hypothetical protein
MTNTLDTMVSYRTQQFTGVAFTLALVSLSLFAETMVDRPDKEVLMIVCDGVRAVLLRSSRWLSLTLIGG